MTVPLPEPDTPSPIDPIEDPPIDPQSDGPERVDSKTGDDGEYDLEDREEGGTEVSGRGHPD